MMSPNEFKQNYENHKNKYLQRGKWPDAQQDAGHFP